MIFPPSGYRSDEHWGTGTGYASNLDNAYAYIERLRKERRD
jgi:hypothetical protein